MELLQIKTVTSPAGDQFLVMLVINDERWIDPQAGALRLPSRIELTASCSRWGEVAYRDYILDGDKAYPEFEALVDRIIDGSEELDPVSRARAWQQWSRKERVRQARITAASFRKHDQWNLAVQAESGDSEANAKLTFSGLV